MKPLTKGSVPAQRRPAIVMLVNALMVTGPKPVQKSVVLSAGQMHVTSSAAGATLA